MLAGIPREYHVSCRVRNSMTGIDEEPNEHADYVIEAATPMAVLAIWLTGKSNKEKAWLRCSHDDLNRLLSLPKNEHIDLISFSTSSPGADGCTDWDINEIYYDEGAHVVEMKGTANLSEFEFEVRISPAVSKQEITYGCKVPKRSLQELTRKELEEVAEYALQLFKEDGVWILGKEWSGADFIDHMTEVLSKYDLVPVPPDDD